LPMPAS